MLIACIEIANFRKLLATRIAFEQEKTVFVGANNSGKTSALNALHLFLVDAQGFTINDFSLLHWDALNAAGSAWEGAQDSDKAVPAPQLDPMLPQLDVWLRVEKGQMHYVQKLLPTLDWDQSQLLGVRLRYEPTDPIAFQQEYLAARQTAQETVAAQQHTQKKGEKTLKLWPQSMVDFLDRRLRSFFKIKGYRLDPDKLIEPTQEGFAQLQPLAEGMEPIEGKPLDGLIQIDAIDAQRGLGAATTQGSRSHTESTRAGGRLSTQLRSYFDEHLNWYDTPHSSDLKALAALDDARANFDTQLAEAFKMALNELKDLGYPGIANPNLKIATKLSLLDGLKHDSAVQYEIPTATGSTVYRLPEGSNGLGYQNLVSMVFNLMRYRDRWMRVGKASPPSRTPPPPPPLHLVLLEEPEAYLHAQVQQVFIKHAYAVLRKLPPCGKSANFRTQLVVSTHSSHVAHACTFHELRYFRRFPPSMKRNTPSATVVNLSSVFKNKTRKDDDIDDEKTTALFVARYIKATHCDLFFADAAIFIEGSAERILLPYLVAHQDDFAYLERSYLSWIEVGGSHAHRFRDLIAALGLTTLIITDLDPNAKKDKKETSNQTLIQWLPKQKEIATLETLSGKDKIDDLGGGSAVRVAYQTKANVQLKKSMAKVEVGTFEDALFFDNIKFFQNLECPKRSYLADLKKIANALDSTHSIATQRDAVMDVIKNKKKAEFALDLMFCETVTTLTPPAYVNDGLLWLIEQLKTKEAALLPTPTAGSA